MNNLTRPEMIEADEYFLARAIDDLEERAGAWHTAEVLRRQLEILERHLTRQGEPEQREWAQ